MNQEKKYILLLILGTAFWGISFPVTKLAVTDVSVTTFLFYRFTMAALVLSVILWKNVKNVSLHSVKSGVLLAIPLALSLNFQTLGLKYTSASHCSFIAGTCVILIPIMKFLLYRIKINIKQAIAAFITLCGLFIITIKDGFNVSSADLFTFAGTITFSLYLINVERFNKITTNNIVDTVVPQFASLALIEFIILLFDGSSNWSSNNHAFWIGVVYCSLFSTAYMYTVNNLAQQYISAERVAIIFVFEPIFASIAAFIILNESFSKEMIIGGSLIFIGTIISESKIKRLKKEKSI